MSHIYYELSLAKPRGLRRSAGTLFRTFLKVGIKKRDIIVLHTPEKDMAAVYISKRSRAEKICMNIKSYINKEWVFNMRQCMDSDWLNKWKHDYKTVKISRLALIIPYWKKNEYRDKKGMKIFIDPGNTFGTGMHETSNMMLEFIAERKNFIQDKAVLDVGCGTGILSVIASKLGAREVFAIDRERKAIRSLLKNIKINSCLSIKKRNISIEKLPSSKRYDYVFANILSKVLIKNVARLREALKDDAELLVSGIDYRNSQEFEEIYERNGLKLVKKKRKTSWVSYVYTK